MDFQAGNNQDANIEISWTDAAEKAINPEYGTADVVAYRIYRSTFQEYGPWELVEEIPATSAGTYKYVDTNSLAGFRYIYNVRAVASPKQDWNEGSVTLARVTRVPRACGLWDYPTSVRSASFRYRAIW